MSAHQSLFAKAITKDSLIMNPLTNLRNLVIVIIQNRKTRVIKGIQNLALFLFDLVRSSKISNMRDTDIRNHRRIELDY